MSKHALLLAAIVAACPVSAMAQASAEGASAIRDSFADTVKTLFGADGPVAGRLKLGVAPEGDHYRLSLPETPTRAGPTVTGDLRPQGKRWSLEGIRIEPSGIVGMPGHHLLAGIAAAGQDGTATIDPTWTMPSTAEFEASHLDAFVKSPARGVTLKAEDAAARMVATPAAPGTMNLSLDADLHGLVSNLIGKSGAKVATMKAEGAVTSLRVDGLSRAAAKALVQETAVGQGKPDGGRTDPAKLVGLLSALADGFSLQQDLGKVVLAAAGKTAEARHLSLGVSSVDEKTTTETRLQVSADGIALQEEVPGLSPTSAGIRIAVSGIPPQAWRKLLSQAAARQADETSLDEFFNAADIATDIEEFHVTSADSEVTARGSMVAHAGSGSFDCNLHVVAIGYDALQRHLEAVPGLLPPGAAVFLKGLAKKTDLGLVWDVSAYDGHVTVNGQVLR